MTEIHCIAHNYWNDWNEMKTNENALSCKWQQAVL